jgi:signal transduction histidine kinase
VNAQLKYLTIYTGEVLKQSIDNKPPDPAIIEHIHDATRNIHALAENLTRFLKTKYMQPSLASINVRNLVEQKLELFSIGVKKRGNQLENDIAPSLLVHQNETLFGILLHNLIDNALKHTAKGNILISSHDEKEGIVSLRIKDSGAGMSEEQVRLYNNFLEKDNLPKSERPPGFGFAIVKEIARILHMGIHIESTLNDGTTVIITMPGK